MATEKRLIDANALFPGKIIAVNVKNPMETVEDLINRINNAPTVDAVPTKEIKLRCIGINDSGIAKITLLLGNRFLDLCVDAFNVREVVHSRFVNVADFGDDQGCFGYCEKCGTVHHSQSPVALKADYRWCRWCGAKMDGDGND